MTIRHLNSRARFQTFIRLKMPDICSSKQQRASGFVGLSSILLVLNKLVDVAKEIDVGGLGTSTVFCKGGEDAGLVWCTRKHNMEGLPGQPPSFPPDLLHA
mmetsp:Transcript_18974/g.45036  ORF Transcript_18974/g.45036 Transcript_18974/m.45036 type:complete len:101 (-) Transcript_18974:335-637(-)